MSQLVVRQAHHERYSWSIAWLPSSTLDNPRRDENEQFSARVGDGVPPEQPSEERQPAQAGRLVVRRLLVAHVDAADDGRLTIAHQHLGVGALRVDRRNVANRAA